MNETYLVSAIVSLGTFILVLWKSIANLIKYILNKNDTMTATMVEVKNALTTLNETQKQLVESQQHHDKQTAEAHKQSAAVMRQLSETNKKICKNLISSNGYGNCNCNGNGNCNK